MIIDEKKILFLLKIYEKRTRIINYIYQCELFNISLNIEELLINNDILEEDLKILKSIEHQYSLLKSILIKTLSSDWSYERVLPYLRAVIIYGIYELMFNTPNVVINELINITKLHCPGNAYKFVNKVLDLVASKLHKK
ncbi:transcription antitermination protein NusB [Metamycoplasma cloacale]|uniref:Transcription antitermination protein NusB n=2 Tax=Metamycoplasma cloacale TaxID=92401 RepID=A0A2Z4LN42_9BACT|nr:transcription antitermination protein NusB [Metamycoplasma cloacale]